MVRRNDGTVEAWRNDDKKGHALIAAWASDAYEVLGHYTGTHRGALHKAKVSAMLRDQ